MTNQSPSDWGQPQWGAKPVSAGARGSTTNRQPTQTSERPPQRRPPPPARPQQRRLFSGIVLGLLGIMVVVIVGFILLVMWVVSMARGPIDATNAFVADIDEGRLTSAYESMCEETRATYSLDDFISHMTASASITDYTFASASVRSNQQTIVSGTIDIDEVPQAADFGLREEGEAWKVCSYPLLR